MIEDTLPLITVCITSYRRPSLLLHAVLSCYQQDYAPLEIDIRDDSPTAEAIELVQRLTVPIGKSLRLTKNEPRLGEVENTNALFREARGKYVVLLHDDDTLLPRAISSLLQAIRDNDGAVLSFGMQQLISNDGEVDLRATIGLNERHGRDIDRGDVYHDILTCALKHQVPNNGYLLLTQAAKVVLYRSHDEIGLAADLDFAIRLGLSVSGAKAVYINRAVSQYRATTDSSSSKGGVFWKIYDYIESLAGLDETQERARQERMLALAKYAVVDNLVMGRRSRALKIAMSSPYRERWSVATGIYHGTLLAVPGLYKLKKYVRGRTAHRL